MATTNPSTMIERADEVRHLASAIFAESFGMDFETALREADRQLDAMLAFAADWDAQAEPDPDPPAPLSDAELADLADLITPEAAALLDELLNEPEPPAPEPVYVPSALDPHEQRAVDKAIFERARGIVPQLVGRFWFVPSRTTGGTVYRVTEHECTCEAAQHGRYCWHRALIGLESELAA